MKKALVYFIAALIPLAAIARDNGGSVGNGGNDVVYDFYDAANRVISSIPMFAELKGLETPKIQNTVNRASIYVTTKPITVGQGDTKQEVVAMNIPAEMKIIINEDKWRAIDSEVKKEALALHELLGLSGDEKSGDYRYSQLYFQLKTSKIGDRLKNLLKPQYLNEVKDPKVQVVVFADFECPFCARNRHTLDKIMANYGDKVQIIFKNKPLSMIHQNAKEAALAGLCANVQGQFKPMHDQLFDNGTQLGNGKIREIARSIRGLDLKDFERCMKSTEAQMRLEIDERQFEDGLFMGTPANLFHTRETTVRFAGAYPYADYEKVILEAIKN